MVTYIKKNAVKRDYTDKLPLKKEQKKNKNKNDRTHNITKFQNKHPQHYKIHLL